METWKKIAIGVVVLAVIWHLAIAMTPKIRVAGPLLARPAEPGYVWTDADNTDSRFFWRHLDVKWVAGIEHTDYNAETTEQEGKWNPLPGYSFVDKSQGLETRWEAGLLHPDYKAWSDDVEGRWIPVTGYRFIYEGDTFVDAVWDPDKRYDDLKVISLTEQDHYKPFPGYQFVELGKSLKVVWTPGIVNADNPRLIAGTKEGTWNVNSGPASRRSHFMRRDNRAIWFAGGVAAGYLLRGL